MKRQLVRKLKEIKYMFKFGKFSSVFAVLFLFWLLGWYWSQEPNDFNVANLVTTQAEERGETVVTGYATTEALTQVMGTLLDKPGGYLSNDVMPPSVLLDNMPHWEFGVLVQSRDLVRSIRKYLARSQSQSTEDPDLAIADPQFHYDSERWILPSTESQYRKGIEALRRYQVRLANPQIGDAQFYARADNLWYWLGEVEASLGSLSQRLSASVGQRRINTDLAGDALATQSTPVSAEIETKTPWLNIDDVFYESRGACWALLHFLRAVEIDFAEILANKNALVSLRQVIRELEATQQTLWSPMVLNGSGFGPLANHSLVMASYIARANAAIIDLRALLTRG